jgi:LysR family transcriptional regulator, glycine cleavage system transcriptional activator
LTQLVLLHDEDDGGLWRRWFATAGIADADVSRGLHILESGLAIDAAIAGQGIALADEFLIADDLAQGRLMKMCDVALSADDCDYYVVSLATAHRQRPVAAFREWLLRESVSLRPGRVN